VPTLLHNFITKLQEDFYAGNEGFAEIGRPQPGSSEAGIASMGRYFLFSGKVMDVG
jgi:hypothetical protein